MTASNFTSHISGIMDAVHAHLNFKLSALRVVLSTMSIWNRDILSSRSTVDLFKYLGYGSHCREGVNGNPVLALD
jgi:hypothetical protein